jgi:hypothetical protein
MEEWFVKENGGTGEFVGIASCRSNWFIAENMLRKNAELVCSLFNAKNIDSLQQSLSGSADASPKSPDGDF